MATQLLKLLAVDVILFIHIRLTLASDPQAHSATSCKAGVAGATCENAGVGVVPDADAFVQTGIKTQRRMRQMMQTSKKSAVGDICSEGKPCINTGGTVIRGIWGGTYKDNLAGCQAECANEAACNYFVWWPAGGGCRLHSACIHGPHSAPTALSGSPTCQRRCPDAAGTNRTQCCEALGTLPYGDPGVPALQDDCMAAGCVFTPNVDQSGKHCRSEGLVWYGGGSGLAQRGYARQEYVKASKNGVECSVYDTNDASCLQARGGVGLYLGSYQSNAASGSYLAEVLVDCTYGVTGVDTEVYRTSSVTVTPSVGGAVISPSQTEHRAEFGNSDDVFEKYQLWSSSSSSASSVLVSIHFSVPATSSPTKAMLKFKSAGYPSMFEWCMRTKECMADLVNDAVGFDLRSKNTIQLQCLDGSLSTGHSDYSACQTWKTCLEQHDSKKALLSLLKAQTVSLGSATSSSSLKKHSALVMEKGSTSDDCINPSIADPESWNCKCHDRMIQSCGSLCDNEASDDCARCKQEAICGYSGSNTICPAWKLQHCGSYPSGSALMQTRANGSRNAEGHTSASLIEESLVRKSADC